ncbi:MAG: hypothetical protein U1E27_05355 [Kiritimatiellia bacterium]|nr:hypothetical protein [Kiritimatiellia bacterium]
MKLRLLSLAPIWGLLLFAGAASVAQAVPRVVAVENLELREGEVFEGDLLVTAQKAQLDGICRNDLFLFVGGTANLAGEFQNDVWALGEAIAFSGQGRDHVRLFGQSVEITGSAANSVVALGGTVLIGPEAVLSRGVWILAKEAIVGGRIEGGASIRAARITISGYVGGDLELDTTDLVVLSGTHVAGNLIYTGETDRVFDRGVTVDGEIIRRPPPVVVSSFRTRATLAAGLWISSLLTGVFFLFFLPRVVGAASRRLRSGFWVCVLTGAISLTLIPILALLGLVTGIGIPLALVLLASGALVFYFGHLVLALRIGSLLLGRRGEQSFGATFPVLAVGLFVQYALLLIPAVAFVAGFFLSAAGAGALILAAAGRTPPPGAV